MGNFAGHGSNVQEVQSPLLSYTIIYSICHSITWLKFKSLWYNSCEQLHEVQILLLEFQFTNDTKTNEVQQHQ